MYKNIDDLPITFGPAELAEILGISRNKAYDLVNQPDFPKYRVGRKIVIRKSISSSGWTRIFLTPTPVFFEDSVVEISAASVVKYLRVKPEGSLTI